VVNAPRGSDHSVHHVREIAHKASAPHVHKVETVVNAPRGSDHSVHHVHVLSRPLQVTQR
jgi:hypothetical protein